MSVRHFLKDDDLSVGEQQIVLGAALELSRKRFAVARALGNHSIGLFFEKPSLRTRVSSETACSILGAHPVQLRADELQMKRGETPQDSVQVLSGYLNLLLARVYKHSLLQAFAEPSSMPIVNGLCDRYHPLQALADLLTLQQEWPGVVKGKTLVYLGDGNNVCHSLMLAGAMYGLKVIAACPKGYEPDSEIVALSRSYSPLGEAGIAVEEDPRKACAAADVLYTDVWTSMGDEGQEQERQKALHPYQLNQGLLDVAGEQAIVMHCLPAHRDEEIAASMLDHSQSRIFRQAHNRLPTTAAIFLFLLAPEVCEALYSLSGEEDYES